MAANPFYRKRVKVVRENGAYLIRCERTGAEIQLEPADLAPLIKDAASHKCDEEAVARVAKQ